jgi:hypothetical protein
LIGKQIKHDIFPDPDLLNTKEDREEKLNSPLKVLKFYPLNSNTPDKVQVTFSQAMVVRSSDGM